MGVGWFCDEDMYIEDLSRADSLRICGPNRQLPRGTGKVSRIVSVHHGTRKSNWKPCVTQQGNWHWWFLGVARVWKVGD